MTAPTLHTQRLTLRPHCAADFDPFAAFLASDRAHYMGGPLDRLTAWSWFASDSAQWSLYGLGALAITDRFDGSFLGQVSVIRPPHWPEPELGWMVLPNAEGRGIAFEAATALRDHAHAALGLTSLVSYIAKANARSVALAERLGARPDPAAALPVHDDPADTVVYRHPAPEARA